MKRISILLVLILAVTTISAYAVPPTQAELDAFQAAVELYDQSLRAGEPDPLADPPPPTPAEIKQQAIDAYKNFIVTYPESMLAPQAQYSIGWCYFEINDHTNAIIELGKVIGDYPTSGLVDEPSRHLRASRRPVRP